MCTLETERLLLRPPEARDIATFAVLLGDYEVSKQMGSAPYPYWMSDAKKLIERAAAQRAAGEAQIFTIARKEDGYGMGTVGIGRNGDGYSLGYCLGRPYWGNGFATEAGRAMVPFGFHTFQPRQLVADHFADNPASGRVLTKLGFTATGVIEERNSQARGHRAPCFVYVLPRDRFETVYRSAIH